VDTRGIPHIVQDVNITEVVKNISAPSCPFGNCTSLPTVNPKNPFVTYETRYQ